MMSIQQTAEKYDISSYNSHDATWTPYPAKDVNLRDQQLFFDIGQSENEALSYIA